MKILFSFLCIFLLSSCTHFQFLFGPSDRNRVETLLGDCDSYPYDNSDDACNIFGWQTYVHQSLLLTKEEHDAALFSLGTTSTDKYKKLILLGDHCETSDIRTQAIDDMFEVSSANPNSFGLFFEILASFQKNDLLNEQNATNLQAELNEMSQKNSHLKAELATTKAKIQAIMEIEKNLKTN